MDCFNNTYSLEATTLLSVKIMGELRCRETGVYYYAPRGDANHHVVTVSLCM